MLFICLYSRTCFTLIFFRKHFSSSSLTIFIHIDLWLYQMYYLYAYIQGHAHYHIYRKYSTSSSQTSFLHIDWCIINFAIYMSIFKDMLHSHVFRKYCSSSYHTKFLYTDWCIINCAIYMSIFKDMLHSLCFQEVFYKFFPDKLPPHRLMCYQLCYLSILNY